jgi:hypothetical protein
MNRFAILTALTGAMLVFAPLAQAAHFTGNLSGPQESPPNASPGTGIAFVDFDTAAHTLHVHVSFSGLTSNTTMAHIHCCVAPPGTAGVATTVPAFVGFPLGVTSGGFDGTFDTLSAGTWNAAFITAHGGTPAGAETALSTAMLAGQTYINIHTVNFPPGEIRSFLTLQADIPSLGQGTLVALVAAMLLLGFALVRRRTR